MHLPVTHFLYLGMGLSMLGVAFLLTSKRRGRRSLAVNCLFAGVSVVAVAFARFWGSNEGQAMALLVMMVALASVAVEPGPDAGGEQA